MFHFLFRLVLCFFATEHINLQGTGFHKGTLGKKIIDIKIGIQFSTVLWWPRDSSCTVHNRACFQIIVVIGEIWDWMVFIFFIFTIHKIPLFSEIIFFKWQRLNMTCIINICTNSICFFVWSIHHYIFKFDFYTLNYYNDKDIKKFK